uniref:Uncharacterized protein n=1 Tax=Ananas comosus var. bracteatus TaxID=296719 RepID=A0A6V7Q8M7_ANACO|nr:unnamed protein product [Ananas comosus var. bracteatus]
MPPEQELGLESRLPLRSWSLIELDRDTLHTRLGSAHECHSGVRLCAFALVSLKPSQLGRTGVFTVPGTGMSTVPIGLVGGPMLFWATFWKVIDSVPTYGSHLENCSFKLVPKAQKYWTLVSSRVACSRACTGTRLVLYRYKVDGCTGTAIGLVPVQSRRPRNPSLGFAFSWALYRAFEARLLGLESSFGLDWKDSSSLLEL